MPTPRFNYTPRWVLDSMKRDRPEPVSSMRPAPAPVQPVDMKNNPDPMVGARLKWLERKDKDAERQIMGDALGSSIRNFGVSLLMNMGPRDQGTRSLAGDLSEAIAAGAAGYQDARDRAKQNVQEGRMVEALRDPTIMRALNPAQQRLIQALPPQAGVQLLAGMVGTDNELQKVENPAEGTLDWYDKHGNLIRRTALPAAPQRQFIQAADGRSGAVVDLTTGRVETEVDLGETEPEYNYVSNGNTINVMSDGELVRSFRLPSQGLQRGTPEYGQNLLQMNKDFRSLIEAKTWDETQVQIESAQQAYRNNEVYNNPQAQLQMVVAFAKILDPNSVVREGEIHIQTSAASLADRIKIAFKQAYEGAVVSQAMMDNLLLGIEEVGKARYDNYIRSVSQMQPLYAANGVSPDDMALIFGDISEPEWMRRGGARGQLTPGGFIDIQTLNRNLVPPAADATSVDSTFRWR